LREKRLCYKHFSHGVIKFSTFQTASYTDLGLLFPVQVSK